MLILVIYLLTWIIAFISLLFIKKSQFLFIIKISKQANNQAWKTDNYLYKELLVSWKIPKVISW